MVYNVREYPYIKISWAGMQTRPRGNNGKRKPREYVNMVCAFDIETTRLPEIRQSIMYIWQLQMGKEDTIVGRTWDEFRECASRICQQLDEGQYIVWFVHNLSFEWQFLRGLYPFTNDDIFLVDSRKVLKADMFGHIELRCSQMHSNSSLAVYLKNMGVKHQKTEMDYSVRRYPWTELSPEEMEYCLNDVRGLVEAIYIDMASTGDTLYTFPLTSTGYVRRDAKQAMRNYSRRAIEQMQPTPEVYKMLRAAFRGGNTHANRSYAGMIVENVHCADRASSYPDVMCNCLFPMSEFQRVENPTLDRIIELIRKRKRAVLMKIAMKGNIRLTKFNWGCPYLTIDKCEQLHGEVNDNGRVLAADMLVTTITDVDLQIVLSEYSFDEIAILEAYHARYAPLPQPLLDVVREYFDRKTRLKGVAGEEVQYALSKALLNGLYGMSAQNPVKPDWMLTESGDFELCAEWRTDREQFIADELAEHSHKAFLSYAWGVWVTAWARLRLEEGIRMCGDGWVYADTDSVYYTGDVDWSEYNATRIKASESSGAYARDKGGKLHYMGTFDWEKTCNRFKTLGAKKYVYEADGELHITIAGVNKRVGAKYLAAHGGIEAFETGFVFTGEAAGVEAVYNDRPEMDMYDTGRGVVEVTPNVSLEPSTYTVGITQEYRDLLENWYLRLAQTERE